MLQSKDSFFIFIEKRIQDSSHGLLSKPSIIFCGCNSKIRKDLHKIAKKLGFDPV